MSARLLGRWPRLQLAALSFGVGEAGAVLVRATKGRLDSGVLVFAALGYAALAALLSALIAGGLAAAFSAGVARLKRAELLFPTARVSWTEATASIFFVAPLALTALAALHLASSRSFKNQELAALLVAVTALGLASLAVFAIAVGVTFVRSARARAETNRFFLFLPGALVSLACAWRAAADNRSGLAQLDPWLFAGPALACAVLLATAPERVRRYVQSAPKYRWLGFLLIALSLAALFAPASAAATLARHGAWSRYAVTGLRLATDWDRDGYSGWFAGGDCNVLDPGVHPGAPEVPENGLDDNCLGGDGSASTRLAAPRPTELGKRLPLERPNVVLVTVETLRADRTSVLGYSLPTTPRLAALARDAVVFERMYATTPTTRLTLPALLSGVLPSKLDWIAQREQKQMRRIGPRTPWLPEILRGLGYATLAVHADFRAFTAVESAGFDRGFDRYDSSTKLAAVGGTLRGFPGARQVDRALELVDETAKRPFFLWVHLLEPHYAYEQSPEVPRFGTSEAALYAADVAEADRQIGRLLDGLGTRGLFDGSIVFISGDHGEEFGEHGERWHGSNLYDPQLRTAAVLRVPGLGARRIDRAVSSIDFVPTLLDALEVKGSFELLHGRNLLPLLLGAETAGAAFLLENFRVDTGRSYSAALLDFPHKLIYVEDGGTLELYDLSRDPGERRDLYIPGDPQAQALAERLYQYIESRRPPPSPRTP